MTDQLTMPDSNGSQPSRKLMMVADDAHVTYKVYAGGKPVGAKSRLFGQREGIVNEVPALRGVSFSAAEGESIGVIGHNGSGKSTLFRAMAGLIPTTKGTIWAADRPVLLGVNAALMPELSGENNIKLGLLAMGFTAEEAAAHVDEIADFAELNEFISHPMRTYSSGMGARLRFAIASARPHSILLLDEALAVGDRRFRLKSEERIRGLRDAAGLVMIVSHSASSLRETCERGLWVHKGELRADGDIKSVIAEYTKWTKNPTSVAVGAARAVKPVAKPARASVPDRADVAAATVTSGTAPTATTTNARAQARRARYQNATRRRTRRRTWGIVASATTVVLAVGAGAAVALVTRQSDRIELDELRTIFSASPTPTVSTTPLLPVINMFAATPTAVCAEENATVDVSLEWDASSAASVSVMSTGSDGAPVTILENQPALAQAVAVPFLCINETQTYTLVTASATGQQVVSTVNVARELLTPSEEPVEPETTPEEPAPPVTEEPAPDPSATPDPAPPEKPTPDPEPTEPTPDPEPSEPTPDPEPTESAPGEAEPTPSEPAPTPTEPSV